MNAFAEERVVLSIDLIRHGARTPLAQIPKSQLHWPEGLSQLTSKGHEQKKALGRFLRKRYINEYQLLPKLFDPTTIYVQSSDTERTIDSANSFLLGLYPLKMRASESKNIPINTVPKDKDSLLIVKPSRTLFSLIKVYLAKQRYKDSLIKLHEKEIRRWSHVSGMNRSTFTDFNDLADNIRVRMENGLRLPNGLTKADADKIITLHNEAILHHYSMDEISRPTGSNFLNAVLNYLHRAINREKTHKYILFLGHDSSIMSVMTTLGVPLKQVTPYAARLNFTLFKNGEKHYIRTYYNDKLLALPACDSTKCSLSQMKSILKGK